jgi:hypothetical protein
MALQIVPQGTLNRLLTSFSVVNFPQLNVVQGFFAPEGSRLTFEGVTTLFLPTMTGVVTSPEPYQMVSLDLYLLKTQGLAAAYEAQRQFSSLIGDCVVRTDSPVLPPYDLNNCAIENVEALDFSGRTANYVVRIRGYYILNAALFQ